VSKRSPGIYLLVFTLLLAALAWLFREQLASGGELLFGGNIDGLLILGLHEHWNVWLQGQVPWNQPPMFYPQSGTLGYSDAFFLPGLLHAMWRFFGFSLPHAFMLAYVVLAAIGFGGQYLFSRRVLKLGPLLSGWVAFMLLAGNGVHIALRNSHLQLLGLWLLPGLAWLGAELVRRWQRPWASFLPWGLGVPILVGLTFWSCYYIMWFATLFTSGCLLIGALCRPSLALRIARAVKEKWKRSLLVCGAGVVGLIPFLLTYLPVLQEQGGYAFFWSSLPSPDAWLSVGAANIWWGSWSTKPWGLQYGYPLVTLIVFLISALVVGWRSLWSKGDERSGLAVILGLGVICCWVLLCQWKPEVSAWVWVRSFVPGGDAIRVPSRLLLFLGLPLLWVIGVALQSLLNASDKPVLSRWARVVTLLLVVSMTVEQWNAAPVSRISVPQLQEVLAVTPPPEPVEAFAVVRGTDPLIVSTAQLWGEDALAKAVASQALLQAYRWQVPTVTGYSGHLPAGWDLLPPKDAESFVSLPIWMARHHLENLLILDATSLKWKRYEPAWLRVSEVGDRNLMEPSLQGLWQGSGFYGTEPWGTWSAAESSLLIRVDDPLADTLILRAKVSAFLPASVDYLVASWTLDDQPLGDWEFTQSHNRDWRELRVPLDRSENEGMLILHVEVPNAVSPSEAGVSEDGRTLALGWQELYVETEAAAGAK